MTLFCRPGGNYPAGTKLKLAQKPRCSIKEALKSLKIDQLVLSSIPGKIIRVSEGEYELHVTDGDMVVTLVGAKSIQLSFRHGSAGAKQDTHKSTRTKEAVSMIVFEGYHETGNIPDKNELVLTLESKGASPKYYKKRYLTSAVLQLTSFKKLRNIRGEYNFEFQGDFLSKTIYNTARKLTGIRSNDNWNPGDIWMFRKSEVDDIIEEVRSITTPQSLNEWVRHGFLTGKMISISLKQATKKSEYSVINPAKYINKPIEHDLSLRKILITPTGKAAFVETMSGFTFKMNARASAGDPTIYIEGTFKKENFAMGSISATEWTRFTNGQVLRGKNFKLNDKDLTWAQDVYVEHQGKFQWQNSIRDRLLEPDFENMDDFHLRMYVSLASHLDFVLNNYDDTMRFGFFSSMKVSDLSSMYVKIK